MIECNFGCCRCVYNHVLERTTKAYKRRGEKFRKFECYHLVTEMKNYAEFLNEADSTALQNAVDDFYKARNAFFKKNARYPGFRSRKGSQSYTSKISNDIPVNPGEQRPAQRKYSENHKASTIL